MAGPATEYGLGHGLGWWGIWWGGGFGSSFRPAQSFGLVPRNCPVLRWSSPHWTGSIQAVLSAPHHSPGAGLHRRKAPPRPSFRRNSAGVKRFTAPAVGGPRAAQGRAHDRSRFLIMTRGRSSTASISELANRNFLTGITWWRGARWSPCRTNETPPRGTDVAVPGHRLSCTQGGRGFSPPPPPMEPPHGP